MSSDKNSTASATVGEEKLSKRTGGLTALSGFHLQFIGTFAYIIGDLNVETPALDVPQAETETLYSIEVGDSDYQRTGKTEIQLVQFKYSANPPSNKIYEKELYGIVKTLRNAKRRIANDNDSLKINCILATNRPMDDQSIEVWEAAKNGRDHILFKEGIERDGFKGYLQDLDYRCESTDSWFETLDRWGKEFGMSKEEIDKGTSEVSGQFLKRVLDGRRNFGIGVIEEAFVGFDSPRKISEMQKQSQSQVDNFLPHLSVPNLREEGSFRRQLLTSQLQQAIQSHALVVLVGDGGNGKSTLLASILRENAESRFVLGRKALALPDDWIPHSVSNWRNAPASVNSTQTVVQAVNRLQNLPGSHPVLVAALDALDEVEMGGDSIAKLVRYFEDLESGPKPPPATLLLTCRREEELKQFRGESGHKNLKVANSINAHTINVSTFEDEDIVEVLEQNSSSLSAQVRTRLLAEFRKIASELNGIDREVVGRKPPVSPINPQVREALRHPIVWGEIFDGNTFDPVQQNSILSGDVALLQQLAEIIVEWFAEKCHKRTQNCIDPSHVSRLLFLVARHCEGKRLLSFEDDWEQPLRQQPHLLNIASMVMKQAISAGLVIGTFSPYEFSWEWRHPFLMTHLVTKHATQSTPKIP